MIATVYSFKCLSYDEIENKTLYHAIVEYYFPQELRHQNTPMSEYLCFNTTSYPTCCRCETTCKDYGFCCLDAFYNNNITSVDEYVELMFNKNRMRNHMQHLPVINYDNLSVKFKVEQIPMVGACDNTMSVYMDLCNKKDSINDARVRAEGFIFKNQYCAQCHGFHVYSNVTFELTDCNTTMKKSGGTHTLPDQSCKLNIYEYEKLKLNTTNDFLEKDNLNCTKRERNLCLNSFVAVFKKSKKSYANPFCGKCDNKRNLGNEVCHDTGGPPGDCRKTDDPSRSPFCRKPHFRLLISFDKDTGPHQVLQTGDPICFRDEYFDIFSGQCKKKPLSLRGIGSPLTLESMQKIDSNVSSTSIKRDPKFQKIYTCMKNLNGSVIIPNNISKLHYTQFTGTNFYFNYTQIKLADTNLTAIFILHQIETLYLVPYSTIPYTQLYRFSLKNHFLHERVCADVESVDSSFQVTSDCNINSNGRTYNITEDAIYWINISHGYKYYGASHCKRFHLIPTCTIGVLNTSKVTMMNKSITVTINGEGKYFTSEQYVPLTEGFGICYQREKSDTSDLLLHYYYFENILSLLLLSISIILDLVSLIVYLSKKHLQNIPGKNLIALCFSMFICDIGGMLLTLTRNNMGSISCRIVAVLLHFFSLALCTWSCVIAYDFWSIFRSKNTSYRRTKLYLRYSFFAWGTPFLAVSACYLVDALSKGALIHYGKPNYCWISPFSARLALYIVPFFIMTTVSFILIFWVISHNIREKRKNHSMLAKKDQLNFCKITIKLCFLLGTTELIGMIQITKAEEKGQAKVIFNIIFGFFHNLLRCSRGTFIFILFTVKAISETYSQYFKNFMISSKTTPHGKTTHI